MEKSKSWIVITIFSIIILTTSCGKKRYEDYNEDDFVEVQGIITKVKRTSSAFDNARRVDIEFVYNLVDTNISYGKEDGIDLVLKYGQPIVVLVHKSDNKISFFGRRGIIDEELLEIGYKKILQDNNLNK